MLPVERTSSSYSTAAAQGGQTSASGTHRVERGDTLSELAQRYGTTVQAFMKANPQIRDADLIFTGDTLNVPTARDQASSTTDTHRIERGDTLSELAQRYNTTVSDFLKANPQIRDPDRIYAGDTLKVPQGGSSSGGAGGTGGAGPTAPAGQPGEPVPQSSRAKEAMDYFIGQGWTREQAAGIVANLQAESNFKADAVGDGGRAYGIAQWHPDRQANFQKFAGHSIRSSTYEEQLKFVQWELTHTESAAGNQLRSADTAREAGAAVSKYYERPADREGEASRRGERAEQILRSYRPDAPTTSGPPQTSGSLVKPVDAKLPPGSEFAMNDPEGAPDARGGRHHAAKDWFAPAGSAVRAPVDGTIVEVRQSKGNSGQVFGGTVKVEADNGQVWVFRHVDPANVRVGQKVDAGTRIASVTDWASGPDHTHVELWKSLAGGYRYENMIDPMTVLKRFA
jgi:murein DD-endopeptidase MepM/ murein hydrolase activator NlpD